MNVATFLRRRHGVLALCDFESVFLCGLVEFYSFDLSVFLFDVTSLATGDLNRADSRLSLLVQSIVLFVCMYKVYVLVMTLSQSKSRKFTEGYMHTFQRIQSLFNIAIFTDLVNSKSWQSKEKFSYPFLVFKTFYNPEWVESEQK